MEKFFWADQIADDLIKRNRGKKEIVCASGITPSGIVHIGNFREVITTDMVVKSLDKKGKKAKFIYSWDDYDRFRKVPANIPESKKKEYEGYIGMPLSDIPSPFEKGKSYAKFFEEDFEKALKKVGISPKFILQGEMNKKCKYADLIKKAVDEREKIVKILNKYRKEPLEKEWYPISVYCEKCGKDFTKIVSAKGYEIWYECSSCEFKSKIDIRKKGIVKLKWRVDWPARWKYESVSFEPGGIDHSTPGGSYTTAKEISKDVFDYEPPLYTFYEWIKPKGGTEFSSSEGNVLTLDQVESIYEPDVLRYIFAGTRPNRGFQISFENDVITIYENFDSLEKKYYENSATPQERRIYETSVIRMGKKAPKRTSFRHLITLVQVGKMDKLGKEDKKRAEKVRNWLEIYAKDDMKFEVQEKIGKDVTLSDLQKKSLAELRFFLKSKKPSEEQLYNEFYKICEGVGLKSEDFFAGAYNVLLNKNRGPRLASLILAIGREKVIKLLEQIK